MALENENKLDSQKIELVLNKDSQAVEKSEEYINLFNIFENMKNKRAVYFRLIVLFLLIGLCVPLVMHQFDTTTVSALALVTYAQGGGNTNPDGSALDTSVIKSNYVINEALKNIKLSEEITISQIAGNITVERLLTESSREALAEFIKVSADQKGKDLYALINALELEYSDTYVITLKDGFSESGSKPKYLGTYEIQNLLHCITKAYSEYYFMAYADYSLPNNLLSTVDIAGKEYFDTLNDMRDALTSMENYCKTLSGLYPNYTSQSDGQSFKDMAEYAALLRDVDVEGYYSYIFKYALAKDKAALITEYNYTLRNNSLILDEISDNLETVEKAIEEYKLDVILIASSETGKDRETAVNSDYYNSLIQKKLSLNKDKHDIEQSIEEITYRIEILKNSITDKSKASKFEDNLAKACETMKTLYDSINSHAEELFASGTTREQYMNFVYSYTDGTNLTDGVVSVSGGNGAKSSTVKSIAMGAGIAVVLAVVIWACDGLFTELKRANKSSKKEENA